MAYEIDMDDVGLVVDIDECAEAIREFESSLSLTVEFGVIPITWVTILTGSDQLEFLVDSFSGLVVE
jgi:hypothetical protein